MNSPKLVHYYNKQLREKLFRFTHASGLNVYLMPKKNFFKKIVLIVTPFGSIHINFKSRNTKEIFSFPAGIAHFLEHQLFKKTTGDILADFVKYGARANAMTNYTYTTYFFISGAIFKKPFSQLLNLVFNPYFSDKNVEMEKHIITQEIKMYNDIPDNKVYMNFIQNLYKKHPVRIDIGGTVESIKEISSEFLYKCYKILYHPSVMILIVSGDIQIEEIKTLLDDFFEKRNISSLPSFSVAISPEDSSIKDKKVVKEETISLDKFCLGFKEHPTNVPQEELHRNIEILLLFDIIFGKTSEMFATLYNKGLIDDSFSYTYDSHSTYAHSVIGGDARDAEKTVEVLLKEIKQTQKKGIKKRDFYRMKRKYLGAYIRRFDSPTECGFLIFRYAIKQLNIFDFIKALKKITRDDLTDRLRKHFVEDMMSISILKSY